MASYRLRRLPPMYQGIIMEDDLRAVMDDDAPMRRYGAHQRGNNWLAGQIALGIVIGLSVFTVIGMGMSILIFGVLLEGISHAIGGFRLR